ncbi:type I secretion system permease/ATPase [Roseospira marina]|uniref:type I secretion system permease/ATPase n=1 Tax=Roseospira marina TaxID=140057 RepID=UPI0017F74F82|nr:type I secretion system permease/ATPase [Roseospira marina]MBB4312585.1 PrtD family type I secretion system ABC transporter [Roseospira marina]MBB5085399.1 PrtD family type I secretion system ABC transporter [Roseospira marina]
MKQSYGSELDRALRAFRGVFVATFGFSFFINLLMFVAPLYMLQVYDRVLTSRSVPTLVGLTVIAAGTLIVMGTLETLRARILVRTGAKLDERLGATLFSAVFRRSVVAPGGGQTQALRDLDSVREFLTGQGLLAFIDAPWVPLFLAAVYLLHPMLGLVATGGAVVIFTLAVINALWSREPLKGANVASINANAYVSTSVRNAEAMEAMGMMPGILRRWNDKHRKVLALQSQASDRAGVIVALSKAVRMFLQIAILGTGAYLVIHRYASPGVMIAASILMGRALAPVEQSVAQWRNFTNARAAYGRLRELLNSTQADQERMALPSPEGHLAMERVVAGPPLARTVVLKGVSFTVSPGEVLGVIGPSAAGKSTLARVLVGVWPPYQGTVRLDEADLAHWDKLLLGQHIGYLPQDVELFDGTVAENIARFTEIDPEAVVRAAQRASVHDMILALPEGYDTQIGAGGAVLSGGQRQRVALARAMYNEPQLIILDEPNANLDSEGEHALMGALNGLRREGKTVVVITHRPTLLNAVDTILVLKNGMVDAIGPRKEVLAKVMQPKAVASGPGGGDGAAPRSLPGASMGPTGGRGA